MTFIGRIFALFMAAVTAFAGLAFTGQLPPRGMPAPEQGAFTQYVNPFAGAGGFPWSGNTFPAACAPFGLVRLGPDTCWPFGLNLGPGTGGYWTGHTHTWGFSHFRISGSGKREGAYFRVMPGLGGADPLKRLTRPLLFDHKRESAQPGYYGVWLPEAACLAEMTATAHTGVHRYTFADSRDARLFIDAGSKLKGGAHEAYIEIVDDRTLRGYMDCNTGPAFFYARTDAPFTATLWREGVMLSGDIKTARSERHDDSDVGADLNFGDRKNRPVTLWMGVSHVSMEGAKANLAAESAGKSFDETFESTRDAWDARLGSIAMESGDPEIKKIFYTALYHCMIHPTNITDADGKYLGLGKSLGETAEGYIYRSDLSLWDTFRTTHPLYCLVAPDIQYDSARSLLAMAAKHGNAFPRWPSVGVETGSMFGDPALMVMAESYLKGILSRAEAEEALGYMVAGLEKRQYGDYYNALGYIPSDAVNENGRRDKVSVSRTLEYAWADYAAYQLALALGNTAVADSFKASSQGFKELFDPKAKYFRAKDSAGNWGTLVPWWTDYYDEATGLVGLYYGDGYSEGSAKHYRWHAIPDLQWFVEQMGEAYMARELEKFMGGANRARGGLVPGSNWWIGNQHNYHAPYMFNEAGRPDLTQKWVRWTLASRFANTTDGLDGDDDLGALSAWYVLSALGFYPIAGTGRYWLGSPAVDRAVLTLAGGKQLTVVATNQGPKNVYVKSVSINGVPLEGSTFTHGQIKDGGTMEFVMSNRP